MSSMALSQILAGAQPIHLQKATGNVLHPRELLGAAPGSVFTIPPLNANPTVPLSAVLQAPRVSLERAEKLPKNFDWRKMTDNLTPVQNQGACGSCWSFSVAGSMGDKFAVKNGKGTGPVILAPTCVLSIVNPTCQGGSIYDGIKGVNAAGGCVQADCMPYTWCCNAQTSAGCATNPCPDSNVPHSDGKCKCSTNKHPKYYTTKNLHPLVATQDGDIAPTIATVKHEIMTNGPTSVSYAVFADWAASTTASGAGGFGKKQWSKTKNIYINGMYNKEAEAIYQQMVASGHVMNTGPGQVASIVGAVAKNAGTACLGFHAVVAVGWGQDTVNINGKNTTVDYWIIRNSWGKSWNGDGYFKVAMMNPNIKVDGAIINQRLLIDKAFVPQGGLKDEAMGGFVGCTADKCVDANGKPCKANHSPSPSPGPGPSPSPGPTPSHKKSHLALWISLGVFGVLIIVAIILAIVLSRR